MQKLNPSLATARPAPGMPCPECGTAITIDTMQLLAGMTISCAACGLKLEIDQKKSADTLSVLKRFMKEFSEHERQAADAIGDAKGGKKRSSRPGRRPRRVRSRRDNKDLSPDL